MGNPASCPYKKLVDRISKLETEAEKMQKWKPFSPEVQPDQEQPHIIIPFANGTIEMSLDLNNFSSIPVSGSERTFHHVPKTAGQIKIFYYAIIGYKEGTYPKNDPCWAWLRLRTIEKVGKEVVTYRKYGFVPTGYISNNVIPCEQQYNSVVSESGEVWLPVTSDFHLYGDVTGYSGPLGAAFVWVVGYRDKLED